LATGRVECGLSAILTADVAGYSRLMGADGGTHDRFAPQSVGEDQVSRELRGVRRSGWRVVFDNTPR
jgi:hypothetical protein